eukprot:gnl/TRDRNA2_/TRDRNA2_155315_c0_seq1.p1 gnl/TRDRNA2_/TRDRNA2_155315_c0~~gnl/TRDRNA2_/TRDRNA2_155315_c0_seq1.p1  ORF type:complete len:213 (+),score=26.16 gnl/TRDRNA2_/TRDRNA2_155315_c0_seq1:62-700(+)
MQHVSIAILLAAVTQFRAAEQSLIWLESWKSSIEHSDIKWDDCVFLMKRMMQARPVHHKGLDDTTLSKSGQLAIRSSTTSNDAHLKQRCPGCASRHLHVHHDYSQHVAGHETRPVAALLIGRRHAGLAAIAGAVGSSSSIAEVTEKPNASKPFLREPKSTTATTAPPLALTDPTVQPDFSFGTPESVLIPDLRPFLPGLTPFPPSFPFSTLD